MKKITLKEFMKGCREFGREEKDKVEKHLIEQNVPEILLLNENGDRITSMQAPELITSSEFFTPQGKKILELFFIGTNWSDGDMSKLSITIQDWLNANK